MVAGLPNVASVGAAVLPNIDPRVWTRELQKVLPGIYGKAAAAAGAAVVGGFAASLGSALRAGDLFTDFEESLTKITTLVGIATDEVDSFGESILELAPAVGRAPQELADGLFFITSAGLRGQEALDALEASAKAAALGLGETQVVADAATSALNAYGDAGLTAEDAVGILVKTVEQGKLEADSLAQSIGRVIPIASEAGVSFNEVGAALAAVSRTGLDAQEGATALRGILATVVRPTQQAKDALAEYGLTTEDLATTLQDDGLIGLLDLLRNSVGDNTEALATIIPNIRALTGFLSLTGSQAEETRRIFGELEVVTGLLDERFAQLEDTQAFRRSQAEAERLAVLTGEGAEAAEALTQILETLPGILEDIIPPLVTVGTNLLNFGGNVVSGIAAVSEALGGIVSAAGPVTQGIGAIGLGLAALYANPVIAGIGLVAAALAGIGAEAERAEGRVTAISDAFTNVDATDATNWERLADALRDMADNTKDPGFFESFFGDVQDVTDDIAESGATYEELAEVVERLARLDGDLSLASLNQFGTVGIGNNVEKLLELDDLQLSNDLAKFLIDAAIAYREYAAGAVSATNAQRDAARISGAGGGADIVPFDINDVDEFGAALVGLDVAVGGLNNISLADITTEIDDLGAALFTAEAEGKSLNDTLRGIADPVFNAVSELSSFGSLLEDLPAPSERSTQQNLDYALALNDVQNAVADLDPAELEAAFDILEEAGLDPEAILTDAGLVFDELGNLLGAAVGDIEIDTEGLGETIADGYTAAVTDAFALVQSGVAEPVTENGRLVGVQFADGTVIPLADLSDAFSNDVQIAMDAVPEAVDVETPGTVLGQAAADAIVEGIPENLASRITGRINAAVESAYTAVRDRWGVDSPSKVWMEGIGVPLGEGVVEGAAAGLGSLSRRFNESIADAYGRATGPAATSAPGGSVINVYNPREESIAAGVQQAASVARVVIA